MNNENENPSGDSPHVVTGSSAMSNATQGDPAGCDISLHETKTSSTETTVETTVNNVNDSEIPRCTFCGETEHVTFCRHCGKEFCEQHASRYNPRLICQDCLTAENLGIQNEPLVDDEGTTHQGRRIRLIGEGWPNAMRVIKDMSDEDLEADIAGLQKLLEECVKNADYARISIAAREYELDYRKHSRYVSAMKRRKSIEQGVLRINSKRVKLGQKPPLTMDEQIAKQLGLTPEAYTALKAVLNAQKKTG